MRFHFPTWIPIVVSLLIVCFAIKDYNLSETCSTKVVECSKNNINLEMCKKCCSTTTCSDDCIVACDIKYKNMKNIENVNCIYLTDDEYYDEVILPEYQTL